MSVMPSNMDHPPSISQRVSFATTRWSIVLAAGHRSNPDADAALENLCRTYWYPLYAFARRRGMSMVDAQDATQEFFARLLEKQFLQAADQSRGRFRSFLLTVFKRFLISEHERETAQKRGGGRAHFSIDVETAENRYRIEPSDEWTAERLFERRWALMLLDEVLLQLREEFEKKGKLALLDACQSLLIGSTETTAYATIAEELKMSEPAVRVAAHRIRQRYRELLKQEVARTVESPDEIDAEFTAPAVCVAGEKRLKCL